MAESQFNNDEALIAGLAAKSGTAVETFVDGYGGKIHGLALRMMGNPAEAQEVTQDVLLTIVNKIGSFERRAALSSWVYRVTANAALMRLRKRKRQPAMLSLEAMQDPMGESSRILQDWQRIPSNEMLSAALRAVVERSVDGLPDEYRVVILMKDIESQSLEEIGAALELTLPAVKSRLHRARMAVRKAVTDYLREGGRPTT
jgi:RNA polymerase sigma-70 factor, ECF subfamily